LFFPQSAFIVSQNGYGHEEVKVLDNENIIYLDTYSMVAHYDVNNDRIEASEYLKMFPELHNFCINHEIQHQNLQIKYGFTWRHIWLDYKDRFKLFWDDTLHRQLRDFNKFTTPRGLKGFTFSIGYTILSEFSMLLALLPLLKKPRQIKQWLQTWWVVIWKAKNKP